MTVCHEQSEQPDKKRYNFSLNFLRIRRGIVPGATEKGINGVSQPAQQVIPAQLAIIFHMADHRLNAVSSPQFLLHPRR